MTESLCVLSQLADINLISDNTADLERVLWQCINSPVVVVSHRPFPLPRRSLYSRTLGHPIKSTKTSLNGIHRHYADNAGRILMASILTSSRLAKLASRPLLANSWYYVAAATFSVCNFPEEIPVIYEYMLKNSRPEDHMDITRKMREALLKGGALGGLPKTINSLTMLKNVTPPDLRESSLMREGASQENVGAAFFDQVYGKISQRVQNQMSSAYPDLCDYAISHVYAPLLSFTRVLGPKETSLVVIACLIPQDVNPQLKGHLKGALNNGATVEEVMELRNMSMEICRWCGIGWRHEVAKL